MLFYVERVRISGDVRFKMKNCSLTQICRPIWPSGGTSHLSNCPRRRRNPHTALATVLWPGPPRANTNGLERLRNK